MSPIRASERDRYPADWPAISRRIRHVRAGGRCECDGRCGHPHSGDHDTARGHLTEPDRCPAINRWEHPVTGSKVVLTVAHLDHTPENVDEENLMAMCQRCHLAYDREHHAETRSATRAAERSAAGEEQLRW